MVKRHGRCCSTCIARKWREKAISTGQLTNHYRRYKLKYKYGITPDFYLEMLDSQGGVCKICGRPPANIALAIDHCHAYEKETGLVKIRGLLCMNCNRRIVGVIEKYKVDPRKIAEYLEAPPVIIAKKGTV